MLIEIKTAAKLLEFFWPKFIEIEGSVLPPWDIPENVVTLKGNFERAIDFEAFQTHTHMIDLFKHDVGLREPDPHGSYYSHSHPDFPFLCETGKKMAQMWFQKLMIDFPKNDFRVYYTQEDNPIVRFHRIYSDSTNWLDEKDWIKDIQEGKVIVYDTRYAEDSI